MINASKNAVLHILLISFLLVSQIAKANTNTTQQTPINDSLAKVWTAINDKFGGENFNAEKWAQAKNSLSALREKYSKDEHSAITTLIQSLEEPSVRLLKKHEKEMFLNEISGKLPSGIGLAELLSVDIDERTNLLTVVTCFPDTPAAKAGIRSGDQIIKINGVSTKGRLLTQAMSKLRVASGQVISLDIMRENEPISITVKSEQSPKFPPAVRTFTQRHGDKLIGYIQYLVITESSAEDFKNSLNALITEGIDALVLDLRNNPGGTVVDALAVTDLFLEKGELIVKLKAGKDKNVRDIAAENNPVWTGPTALLQNRGSASAAELIAGALKANDRTTIIGEKSFGKGLMHTMVQLEDGGAVMFHVGRLITPDNRDILHEMIIPDHVIEQSPSAIMSPNQELVGTELDRQYQYALMQLLRHN